LTVKRTGGLAGFQDVLVVARDGLVSVTHRGQKRRQCKLTPVALELVTKAASQVPLHDRPSVGTQPSFPDDLVTLVLSPSGGPVRLEALGRGLGSRAQAFQDLLNDLLNGGAAASQRCAPL
jgi:hypothetical protein